MKKMLMLGAVALLMVAAAVVTREVNAADKVLTVKEIMKIVHDEDDGLMELVGAELKKKEPKWDEVSAKTKEWVKVAADLGKNKVKKGEEDSWKMLTKKWLDDSKALDAAASKKDPKSATVALKVLEGACKDCHKPHK